MRGFRWHRYLVLGLVALAAAAGGGLNAIAAPVEVASAANFALYANCGFPRPSGPEASYRLIENASGQPVMVFRLQAGDTGGCRSDRGPKIRERAEVRSAWLVKGMGYSLRFRAKFSNPSLRQWHSIFQIHQNDVNCVFLKMEMRRNGIELYYRDVATQRNNCVDGGDKRRRQIPIFDGRGYQDKWLDVRVDFTLSDKADGRIEVFLNGTSRAVIDGANSLFLPYLKFGLYRIPKVKDGARLSEGTAMLDLEDIRLRPATIAPGYPRR